MSHKMPGPPIAPFPNGRMVIVDLNSTSATEDGTMANPYKTIQAALDAKPTAVDLPTAFSPWVVDVVPGFYDEDLTIPASGIIMIRTSRLSLGTGSPARSITYTAQAGPFSEPSVLILSSLRVPGGITVSTVGAGDEVELRCLDVECDALLDGTGIVTSGNAGLTVERGNFSGGINFNGRAKISDCSPSGVVSTILDLKGANITGSVTTTGTNVTLRQVSISGNLTTGAWDIIEDVSVLGNMTLAGVSGQRLLRDVSVSGTVACAEAGRIVRLNAQSTFTLTSTSGTTLHDCKFTGLVTLPASTGVVVGCVFNGGITVVDTSATFFLCRIFGTFTGPASSYRVDAPTIFAHATTLAGGATLSLQQEPVPLLTTTLTIPGGNGVGTVGDLNSSPVLLLASPGAGLAHVIHRVQWMLDYGTVGYDNGAVGNLKLVYGTVASDPEAHTGPSAAGFVNQIVDTFSMTGLQGEIPIQTDPVSVAATADFFGAAGDSPIKLKVWYETITLAL